MAGRTDPSDAGRREHARATSGRILGCVVPVFAIGGLGLALRADGTLTRAMAVHATLMIVAWGGMIPLGGIVARYFKVVPGQSFPAEVDNPVWWTWHRGLQYGGMAVAVLALASILWDTGGFVDTLHARCGLAVMGLGGLQVFSPLLRGTKGGPSDDGADPDDPATWRGDHYDMTPRRRLFEAWHKTAGWALIALAAVTILLGIALVGAPSWLLLVAGMLQGAVLCGLLDGRLRGRWVDTHAALWGPGAGDPGIRGERANGPSGSPTVDRAGPRARPAASFPSSRRRP